MGDEEEPEAIAQDAVPEETPRALGARPGVERLFATLGEDRARAAVAELAGSAAFRSAMSETSGAQRVVEQLQASLGGAEAVRRITDQASGAQRMVEQLQASLGGAEAVRRITDQASGAQRMVEQLQASLGGAEAVRRITDQASGAQRMVEQLQASLGGAEAVRRITDQASGAQRMVEQLHASLGGAESVRKMLDQTLAISAVQKSFSSYLTASDLSGIRGARQAIESLSDVLSTRRLFDQESLARVGRAFKRMLPRNLRDAEVLDIALMRDVMSNEGIPFCLVPDPKSATALLQADNAEARRAVLVERADSILDSCEEVLDLCVDPRIVIHQVTIRQAIAAYRAGLAVPAQAAATIVLDSVLLDHPDITHRGYLVGSLSGPGGVTWVEYCLSLDNVRLFALTPISAIHIKDERGRNEPLSRYSRHSSVHRMSEEQYTPANAVQALMLSTSLLGFVQGLW